MDETKAEFLNTLNPLLTLAQILTQAEMMAPIVNSPIFFLSRLSSKWSMINLSLMISDHVLLS